MPFLTGYQGSEYDYDYYNSLDYDSQMDANNYDKLRFWRTTNDYYDYNNRRTGLQTFANSAFTSDYSYENSNKIELEDSYGFISKRD